MEVPATHASSYQSAPQLGREIPFDFKADNKDYWVLEIKNIFLSVVTFGIYSAWASVKRRKYLAQHTFLEGANFDYTADPKVILRSRIVMFAIFAMMYATQFINETVYTFSMLMYMLCIPWAIVSSFAFHAKNTTYRGARFSFHADTKSAYLWYFKLCALYFLSFGLALPLVMRLGAKFVAKHHRLGGKPFSFNEDLQPFVKANWKFLLKGGACMLAFGLLAALSAASRSSGEPSLVMGLVFGVGFFAAILGLFWAIFTTIAEVTNLTFDHVSFGEHRLKSNQEGMGLFRLMITNYLLLLCTLGLAFPIVVLRMRRFRYDHLKVLAQGPLLQGVALDPVGGSRGGSDAVGTAMLDFDGGFDFGI